MFCNKGIPLPYNQYSYLFPLSFVFQTWIFLLCYFSCGRQTCFDCSMGGLSFPTHRLSLFYSTGIARGCLFSTKQKPPPFGGGFLCAALLIYNVSGYIKTQLKRTFTWRMPLIFFASIRSHLCMCQKQKPCGHKPYCPFCTKYTGFFLHQM